MDNRFPRVSVVMSVYNGEKYLREAVDSILNQTFTEFEFIIVDDNSTDGTAEILNGYSDPRIVQIRNDVNIGQPKSLNKGMEAARGEYIARMDADDVSLPDRFQLQVTYLSEHNDIGILGTKIEIIDEIGDKCPHITWHLGMPTEPEVIGWYLLYGSPLAHPSVMMRRKLIVSAGGYSNSQYSAADYGLWVKLSRNTKIANLNEKLLLYRWHNTNMSVLDRVVQRESQIKISNKAIREFLGRYSIIPGKILDDRLIGSEEYDYRLAKVMFNLYVTYAKSVSLTVLQKKAIRKDFARRIFQLANNRYRTPRFWIFMILACWFDQSNISLLYNLFARKFLRMFNP